MVQTRVTLLHAHVDAMRITPPIDPASVVHASRLDNQRVVSIPVANRVSVPGGIRPAFGAHILGKWPPVHPDSAPYLLVLRQDHYAARHLGERDSSCFVGRAARKPERIAGPPGIVGVRAEWVGYISLKA